MSVKIEGDKLHYDAYVKVAMGSVLREALPCDDPRQLYNYLKESEAFKNSKHTPEDFGIYNPRNKEFDGRSREDLIDEILSLRKLL